MSIDATGIDFPSVIDGKKRCPKCTETKDVSEYCFTTDISRNGKKRPRIAGWCKPCSSKVDFRIRTCTMCKCQYESNTRPYCKTCRKIYRRDDYLKNKEKVKLQTRAWKDENREEYLKQQAEAEALRRTTEDKKKYMKEYSSRPERRAKVREHARMRAYNILLSSIKFTPEEQARVDDIYRRAYDMSHSGDVMYHVDHIIPLSRGGKHHPDNLQILTATENMRKGSRI